MELGVGVREGRFERFDVGEEGLEVVDGVDEVLVVSFADLLDLGLFGSGEELEVVEERLRLACAEGFADERA